MNFVIEFILDILCIGVDEKSVFGKIGRFCLGILFLIFIGVALYGIIKSSENEAYLTLTVLSVLIALLSLLILIFVRHKD